MQRNKTLGFMAVSFRGNTADVGLGGAFSVTREFQNIPKTFFEALNETAMKRRRCGSELVVSPESFFPFCN